MLCPGELDALVVRPNPDARVAGDAQLLTREVEDRRCWAAVLQQCDRDRIARATGDQFVGAIDRIDDECCVSPLR